MFAVALDHPGWARRARSDAAALETLAAYAPRYGAVAGVDLGGVDLEVVGEVAGGSGTDFGVIAGPGPWDEEPTTPAELEGFAGLLERSWTAFDALAAAAPAELRKGPRGGGRDTAEVVAHVEDGERGYSPKAGVRLPGSTPWRDRRAAVTAALRSGCPDGRWPARYVARRFTWHVLDHLWEIQDRSTPTA